MKIFALLLSVVVQAVQTAAPAPLVEIRTTLRQLRDQYEQHRATYGATTELTSVKHQFRDWVESRLADEGQDIDVRRFVQTLHNALRDADLFCSSCDENDLGYVDPVLVRRVGELLVVITSVGISCSYDDSVYGYVWRGGRWQRVWEYERTNYTPQDYLPQAIQDIQVSAADASGNRTLMLLGSQPKCFGSFLNVYARAWRLARDYRTEMLLDHFELAYDGYPPILGRVLSNDVTIKFTADGFLSGDSHTAVRHFALDGGTAKQVDPIAVLPRDFVLEWLDAPWEESRTRAEAPSLQALHAAIRRPDKVGDIAEPPKRCTIEPDLWQVGTRLFESPKHYYRVRWQQPYTFTMVGISDTPYADCTIVDPRASTYPRLLR